MAFWYGGGQEGARACSPRDAASTGHRWWLRASAARRGRLRSRPTPSLRWWWWGCAKTTQKVDWWPKKSDEPRRWGRRSRRVRSVGGPREPAPLRQNTFRIYFDICAQTPKPGRSVELQSTRRGERRPPARRSDRSEASLCPGVAPRSPPGQGIAAVAVHAVVVPPSASPTPPPPSPQEEPSTAAGRHQRSTRGEKGAERSLGCPRIAL